VAFLAEQLSASCGLEHRSWLAASIDHRFPGGYESGYFHSSGSRHQCSTNSALNIAQEIARKLRLNYVFGREFVELTQGSNTSPAYHGQATLSRWTISNSRIIRFQEQSSFWKPRWYKPMLEPFQERLGGRIALVSEIKISGASFLSYNLHLESRANEELRLAQLNEVLKDARAYEPAQPGGHRWRP